MIRAQDYLAVLHAIQNCLSKAAELYNMPALENTEIRFDMKGQSAIASASRRNGKLILRFNADAIGLDPAHVINNTIPHEVAHLVNYLDNSTGKNHDAGWKRVCIKLGGTGERVCGSRRLDALKPARRTRKHEYRRPDTGGYVTLGNKYHRHIQQYGKITLILTDIHASGERVKTKVEFFPEDYKGSYMS